MMQRRGFLGAMLAACAAPAIVRAGSLMRINPAIVGVPMVGFDQAFFTREALRIAHSRLNFIANLNREYDTAWQPGARIVVRAPIAYKRKEFA